MAHFSIDNHPKYFQICIYNQYTYHCMHYRIISQCLYTNVCAPTWVIWALSSLILMLEQFWHAYVIILCKINKIIYFWCWFDEVECVFKIKHNQQIKETYKYSLIDQSKTYYVFKSNFYVLFRYINWNYWISYIIVNILFKYFYIILNWSSIPDWDCSTAKECV